MNYGYGPPQGAYGAPRQEVPLFQAGNVQVTSARFVCWNQTYPVVGITSVSQFVIQPSTGGASLGAVFFGLMSLCAAMGAIGGIIAGSGQAVFTAIMFALVFGLPLYLCIRSIKRSKPTYAVSITTAGMNVRAIVSPDQQLVQGVIGALNQAIAMR